MLQERLVREVGALEAKRHEECQRRSAIDEQLADSATCAPRPGPPLAAAATKDTEEAAAATKKEAVRSLLCPKNVCAKLACKQISAL